MADIIKTYNSVPNPFFMESIEDGTDISKLEYSGRGEEIYADARQVTVRSCHDILVSCENKECQRGILLVMRRADPARDYLWPLGGFYNRGVTTPNSLVSRINGESGLDVKEDSLLVLGHTRVMWKTTPNKKAEEKRLPLGIDETGLLWYAKGNGSLRLDSLHGNPLVVTPEMYIPSFREKLHPYVQFGMDRAINLI